MKENILRHNLGRHVNITVHPKMADPIITDLADITPPRSLQISLGQKSEQKYVSFTRTFIRLVYSL